MPIVTNLGGGGVAIVPPEQTVIGSALYTIPVGKMGVARISQGDTPCEINDGSGAAQVLSMAGPQVVEQVTWQANSHGTNAVMYKNLHDRRIEVTGMMSVTGPGFQQGAIRVGPTLIGNLPFSGATRFNYPFKNLPLLAGETIRIDTMVTLATPVVGSVFVKFFTNDAQAEGTVFNAGGGGIQGAYTSDKEGLTIKMGSISEATQTIAMKAGDTIEGGEYAVEIYTP